LSLFTAPRTCNSPTSSRNHSTPSSFVSFVTPWCPERTAIELLNYWKLSTIELLKTIDYWTIENHRTIELLETIELLNYRLTDYWTIELQCTVLNYRLTIGLSTYWMIIELALLELIGLLNYRYWNYWIIELLEASTWVFELTDLQIFNSHYWNSSLLLRSPLHKAAVLGGAPAPKAMEPASSFVCLCFARVDCPWTQGSDWREHSRTVTHTAHTHTQAMSKDKWAYMYHYMYAIADLSLPPFFLSLIIVLSD
jgi:hypothetical protein